VLRRCAELTVTDLTRRSADYLSQVDRCVRVTETNVLGMRKIAKRYSRLPADNQQGEMLKKLLTRVRQLVCLYKCTNASAPVFVITTERVSV